MCFFIINQHSLAKVKGTFHTKSCKQVELVKMTIIGYNVTGITCMLWKMFPHQTTNYAFSQTQLFCTILSYFSILCFFIPALNHISEERTVLFTALTYIYLTIAVT